MKMPGHTVLTLNFLVYSVRPDVMSNNVLYLFRVLGNVCRRRKQKYVGKIAEEPQKKRTQQGPPMSVPDHSACS